DVRRWSGFLYFRSHGRSPRPRWNDESCFQIIADRPTELATDLSDVKDPTTKSHLRNPPDNESVKRHLLPPRFSGIFSSWDASCLAIGSDSYIVNCEAETSVPALPEFI